MSTPDVAAQVAAARVQHAAVLVDALDVLRPSTATTPNPFDPRTSALTKVNTAPVPALVQASSSTADDAASPGAEDVKVDRYVVKLDAGVGFQLDVRPGDWLLITSFQNTPFDKGGNQPRVVMTLGDPESSEGSVETRTVQARHAHILEGLGWTQQGAVG